MNWIISCHRYPSNGKTALVSFFFVLASFSSFSHFRATSWIIYSHSRRRLLPPERKSFAYSVAFPVSCPLSVESHGSKWSDRGFSLYFCTDVRLFTKYGNNRPQSTQLYKPVNCPSTHYPLANFPSHIFKFAIQYIKSVITVIYHLIFNNNNWIIIIIS